MSFHGSYRPQDVEFLLKPLTLAQAQTENVVDKERLIQSGARHYSEVLTPESLPSPAYRALFARPHALNRERMARDCLVLASLIARRHGPAPVLVSLALLGAAGKLDHEARHCFMPTLVRRHSVMPRQIAGPITN